jgi:hypothetical protein
MLALDLVEFLRRLGKVAVKEFVHRGVVDNIYRPINIHVAIVAASRYQQQ